MFNISILLQDWAGIVCVQEEAVVHRPPPRKSITRYVMCKDYRTGMPSSCPMGDRCNFLHIDEDVENLVVHGVHMNIRWATPQDCYYPRVCDMHQPMRVFVQINGKMMEYPASRILVTAGVVCPDNASPLALCQDFHTGGFCPRASLCRYVHVLHVDPVVDSVKRRLVRPAKGRTTVGVPAPRGAHRPYFPLDIRVLDMKEKH